MFICIQSFTILSALLKAIVPTSNLQNKKLLPNILGIGHGCLRNYCIEYIQINILSWKLFALHFNLFPFHFFPPGKICRHVAQKTCQLHHSFSAPRQYSPRGYCQCVALITKQVLGVHANSTVYFVMFLVCSLC